MASRQNVNIKFVSMLTTVIIIAVAGVLGTLYFFLSNSASDLAKMGDKRAAEGKYKEAASAYSKAVNKEKTNPVFLRKWIDTLKKTTPEEGVLYGEAFEQLRIAMYQFATISDDFAAQREYLEMRKWYFEENLFLRDGYESIAKDADTIIARYPEKAKEAEILRRFRGLANFQIMMNVVDVPAELVSGVKADLEAALAADPTDQHSAYGLSLWYSYQAQKARAAGNTELEKEMTTAARQVPKDFLAKNPQNPLLSALALRQELEASITSTLARAAAQAGKDKPTIEMVREAQAAFASAHKADLEDLTSSAMAQADKLPQLFLRLFREHELTIDPKARLSRTESLHRAMLEKHPTDADLILQLATLLEEKGEHRMEAVEVYQKLVDQKSPPLSTEGLFLPIRRIMAMFGQGEALFHEWQYRQGDAAERTKVVDRLKELHKQLVPLTEPTDPRMILTEAELSLMSGDLPKTDRLLAQLPKTTLTSSSDALMLTAEVSILRNKPGAARDALRMIVEKVQPSNLIARIQLAGVEEAMGELERARALLESVRQLQPDNKYIQDRLALLDGKMHGGKVDDPILQVLFTINQLSKDLAKDPQVNSKVAAQLRADMTRLNNSQDPRLVQALAVAEVRSNNMPGAIAALQAGIAANPDSRALRGMLLNMTEKDDFKRRLGLAEIRDEDPTSVAIEKYVIYHDFQKMDEARAQLAEAIKLSADDPRVLELEFMQAVEDKKFPRAEAITDRAAKEDLDGSNGDTYRARLESAKGNNAEAVRIMTESVARGGAQPETWRLLGRLQNSTGRPLDAIASFRAALKLRPSDVASIKDLLSTQIGNRQAQDALLTARSSAQYAEGDPGFVHMWLNLEATIGDRPMAAERRAKLYALTPEDQDNAMALAAIYMDSNELGRARPIIDTLKSKTVNLAVINLDAGWYWAGGDRARAKKVFEDFIAAQDKSTLTTQPYMAYAEFLVQRQDVDGALAVLEAARPYQSAASAEADRSISDANFQLGRLDASMVATRRVIEAKADTPNKLYRKRLVETLINLKKFAEADEQLKDLMAQPEVDSVTMMLASDSREGQKDPKGQRDLLDQAVAKFPGDAMVFVKRGQAVMMSADDPAIARDTGARAAILRDAVEDFTTALKLNPSMYQALRMRASAYQRPELNKTEEAITDLRSALASAPNDDNLFVGLLQFLLANRRDQDAMEVASAVMEKRPKDAAGYVMVGQIFANAEKWDQAIRMMEKAFETDQQDAVAQRYLDTLLSASPPRTTPAENLLNGPLKSKVATSPGFLMAQARVHMQMNRSGQALRSAADSLALLDVNDSRIMLSWFNEMKRILPDKANLANFLTQLGNTGPAAEWLNCYRATLLIDDQAGRAGAIELMRGLIKNSKNVQLRQFTFRILGMSLYNFDRIDEAVVVMQDSLKEFPDDYESLNNLAYALAKKQNKPQEALPLAERSVAGRPQNADALDTLGMCYLMLGKPTEALATLNRVGSLQMSPQTAISITIHMAESHLALGNKEQAKTVIDNAGKMAESAKDTTAQTKTEIEDLRKKIMAP